MLFSQNLEMRVLSVLSVYSITKTVFAFCESSKTNLFSQTNQCVGFTSEQGQDSTLTLGNTDAIK